MLELSLAENLLGRNSRNGTGCRLVSLSLELLSWPRVIRGSTYVVLPNQCGLAEWHNSCNSFIWTYLFIRGWCQFYVKLWIPVLIFCLPNYWYDICEDTLSASLKLQWEVHQQGSGMFLAHTYRGRHRGTFQPLLIFFFKVLCV